MVIITVEINIITVVDIEIMEEIITTIETITILEITIILEIITILKTEVIIIEVLLVDPTIAGVLPTELPEHIVQEEDKR